MTMTAAYRHGVEQDISFLRGIFCAVDLPHTSTPARAPSPSR